MRTRKQVAIFGLLAMVAVVLGACRAEERNRITRYEPGVYKGTPDTKLTAAQQKVLRQRSVYQGSTGAVSGGGGGGSSSSASSSKPIGSTLDIGKLNMRVRGQGGSGL